MSYIEKEKLIKADIASIENRVRHAFNQGYDLGFKDGKSKQANCSEIPTGSTTKNDLGVDAISRQAVIDLMMQKWGENFSGDDAMQESIDAIRELPSVTPQEPKTGHWIDTNDDGFVYHRIYKCSHCGATVCEYPQNMHESKYKYCSSCGAKMVEPQESEVENGNNNQNRK